MLEKKILTWENLLKRGFVEPSKCVLCGLKEETVKHLFVECNFTKDIWFYLQKELNYKGNWEGGQAIECFLNWIKQKDNVKELPCYLCWEIWKHRNLVNFEDCFPNRVRVCNNILQYLGDTKNLGDKKFSIDAKDRRIDRPPILDWDLTVGFFYGASQERGSKCGVGAMIKCPLIGTFRLKMNYGRGTNTKGELLALWCILYFACIKKINRIQLVGDSKITIDWFTNVNDLQVISLQPWISRIRELNERFIQLKAQHIYRSYNKEVDLLPKYVLLLDEDGIYYAEGNDGNAANFIRLNV
jgi:ribonuclease HI